MTKKTKKFSYNMFNLSPSESRNINININASDETLKYAQKFNWSCFFDLILI